MTSFKQSVHNICSILVISIQRHIYLYHYTYICISTYNVIKRICLSNVPPVTMPISIRHWVSELTSLFFSASMYTDMLGQLVFPQPTEKEVEVFQQYHTIRPSFSSCNGCCKGRNAGLGEMF